MSGAANGNELFERAVAARPDEPGLLYFDTADRASATPPSGPGRWPPRCARAGAAARATGWR